MLGTLLRLTALAAVLSLAPAKAVAAPNVHHLSGGGSGIRVPSIVTSPQP